MNDLKFAFRQLLNNPGFTAVAVLTLALGIGANTAVFSLVNSILLRTVSGVREPDQLLAFDFKPGDKPAALQPAFSYPDFIEFQQGIDVFDGMAASDLATVTVGAEDQAEKTEALLVTPNWFSFLGVRMVAGRGFAADEGKRSGADAVAVISESLWRRRFNGDLAVIGQTIRLNDHLFTVIGVAAPFRVNPAFITPEVWAPLSMHAQLESTRFVQTSLRYDDELDLLKDRRSGISVTWMARLLTSNETLAPYMSRGAYFFIRSERAGTAGFIDEIQRAIWSVNGSLPLGSVQTMGEVYHRSTARTSLTLALLSITGALTLALGLVGIYGVISYTLTQRTREIGVRMALGARNAGLKRMLLRQVLLLVAIGVALGLGGAALLARLMESLLFGVGVLDVTTYVTVSAILVITAALAAYLPARRVTRIDPMEALRYE